MLNFVTMIVVMIVISVSFICSALYIIHVHNVNTIRRAYMKGGNDWDWVNMYYTQEMINYSIQGL